MTEHRREYNRNYLREWRKVNREKMRAYDKKWREANPEVAKESDKRKQYKHYHSHPEYRAKAVARASQWQRNNPEKTRLLRIEVGHRRRARKHNTSIGPILYKEILIQANGLCGICREPLGESIEFDHIVPLSRGGTHTQDNLQATHPLCNRRKNARLMSELAAAS